MEDRKMEDQLGFICTPTHYTHKTVTHQKTTITEDLIRTVFSKVNKNLYAVCVQQTLSICIKNLNDLMNWLQCRQFANSQLIVQTQSHWDEATAQWTPTVQRCNSIHACAAEARVSAGNKHHCRTWLQQTDFTSLGRCIVILWRRWCLVLCSVVMYCLAVASGCTCSTPRNYLVLHFPFQ